jgi:hypothetical protein
MYGEILDHMPQIYIFRFTDMYGELLRRERSIEELHRFVQEHIPDVGKVFANAFSEFRKMHGGKGA